MLKRSSFLLEESRKSLIELLKNVIVKIKGYESVFVPGIYLSVGDTFLLQNPPSLLLIQFS
jgi:hypothetical protein